MPPVRSAGMRLRRLSLWVLVGVLALPALAAGAFSQTEVDRAADQAARAEARRLEAQQSVDAWADKRGTALDRAMAASFALAATNTRLEEAAFRVFELRDEILDAESRLRELRDSAETRVVETYMNGTAGGLFSIWSASSFEQSVLMEEAAASARRADTLKLAELSAERERLGSLQDGYRAAQEDLVALRETNLDQSHALHELFLTIDARYAESFAGLESADADYVAALGEWEMAQRRRAARAGVEPWRPLVQQYFPAELTEEALRVMACESGGNADAVHPESDASGLFQFLAGTWSFSSVNAGFSGASRFDAEANIAAAAWLVDYSIRSGHPRGAWGHWVCQP